MRAQGLLTLWLAIGLNGCMSADKASTRPHLVAPGTAVASRAPIAVGDHGNGIVSNNGGSLLSDHGAALVGKAKIPAGIISNNSGSLIANNSGAIIANNGGGIVSNNGGGLSSQPQRWLLNLDERPVEGFSVVIVDAAGNPVLDSQKQPFKATTDQEGNYRFDNTPIGANLIVRVELPPTVGPMLAFLPNAGEKQPREANINATSTLVLGYILDQYVKGDDKVLAKLPGDVEATTRARAASAIGDTLDLKAFKPEVLVPAVENLRAKDSAFDSQVKVVEKLLLAGLSNLGDGENALRVALSTPRGLARLSDGSLLVSERNGQRVRRIDLKTGIITTFAGKNGSTTPGDGGPATDAFLDQPMGIAVDRHDNVYIADFLHRAIRRVDAITGIITVAAGNYNDPKTTSKPVEYAGAPAASVPFDGLRQIAIDANDRLIMLSGQGMFRVENDGKLTRLVVPTPTNINTLTRGPDRQVYYFENLKGNIYRLDGDVFKSTELPARPGQAVGNLQFGPDGSAYLVDGSQLLKCLPGGTWQPIPFTTPHGVLSALTVDESGILVGDFSLSRIWKLNSQTGEAVAIAGQDSVHGDAVAADQLSLNVPTSLALDPWGNLLIADGLNSVIWQRKDDGVFYRFAGGVSGNVDDIEIGDGGPARDARMLKVFGILPLSTGSILVTEATPPLLARVREILPDGSIESRPIPQGMAMPTLMVEEADGTILASDYVKKKLYRWRNDSATEVKLDVALKQPSFPIALPDGSFYISDAAGCAVYRCKDGHATLVAGGQGAGFSGDGGTAIAAKLNNPIAIALSPDGDLYISDSRNDRVRRVHNGMIETIAGPGGRVLTGPTPDDSLKEPLGLVFDHGGNLYIADSKHNQIKRVEAATLK